MSALEVVVKDGMIHVTAGTSYMGHPLTCGDPMTPLEAEKHADALRAAARKLRNKDTRKKLGDY